MPALFKRQFARDMRVLLPTFALTLWAFMPSLPAGAVIDHMAPNLKLTSAMIAAGGGAAHFSSFKLFKVVCGAKSDAEATKLTKQFGADNVKTTFAVFDYAVDDTIKIATAKHIALPAPSPDPTDGKALALAIYGAGAYGNGKWDVGYMLEAMITHPIHHLIMNDIDAKFTPRKNAEFHIVLTQMMHDLAAVYS